MRVLPEILTDVEWEGDEIWSFVNSKENPFYLWLAIESKNPTSRSSLPTRLLLSPTFVFHFPQFHLLV